ncbi:MAG TPA: hypothetical protein VHL58_00900 [Thermoanaerobaculia bacterium]|nr:hypothetical protein [Thermoanaerobaculia bacterium]
MASVLGARRQELGYLSNVEIDIAVISSTGAVLPYVSSVDNGTGDSILRTE